jgi:hypothetical protein
MRSLSLRLEVSVECCSGVLGLTSTETAIGSGVRLEHGQTGVSAEQRHHTISEGVIASRDLEMTPRN